MNLEAGVARIRMDPLRGGRLASLQVDGRELLVTGDQDVRGWGAYPMLPWAGRIRSGRFVWQNETIQLPITLPPHAIHGTVLDREWAVVRSDTMVCDLGADWPWPGRARSRVELCADRFVWTLAVESDRVPFPVVIGWHPWFLREPLPGVGLQFSVSAQEMYVKDRDGIPNGSIQPPTPGPWDDCFRSISAAPTLNWSDGFTVEMESSCSHWVVYDEPSHAVCIEPQSGPPDAFNLGGYEVASPGHPVQHKMVIRWQ